MMKIRMTFTTECNDNERRTTKAKMEGANKSDDGITIMDNNENKIEAYNERQ